MVISHPVMMWLGLILFGGDWHINTEPGAPEVRLGNPDGPTVAAHDFGGDGKPYPLSGNARIQPLAALQYSLTLVLGDSRAVVFDIDTQLVSSSIALRIRTD